MKFWFANIGDLSQKKAFKNYFNFINFDVQKITILQ